MNEDTIKGNWKQFKGNLKEQWGKLTDDDFDVIDGRREQLLGKLQERQGLAREAAESRSATGKPATQPSVSTTDLFSPSGGVSAALVHHTY